MSQSVVGVFDTENEAKQAVESVVAAGVNRNRVQLSAQGAQAAGASSGGQDKGFWSSMKDALGFGDDDDDRYGYREATRRGGIVVCVEAEDREVDQVVSILQGHNTVNLDDRAEQWKGEGWAGYDTYRASTSAGATGRTAAAGETAAGMSAAQSTTKTTTTNRAAAAAPQTTVAAGEAIPVIEENLQVGKQVVTRGGVRIHSHVTERPVEAQVNLREEHVKVERRPVDRPLTSADAATAFKEQAVELTETAERAVVAKQARVVEEVTVGKEATERTETVRDTVRRTDVDVERIDEADPRFRPAYEFADELSQDARYHGRTFDTFESDARRSFEQRNPTSKWDEVKDAIRSRYDRSRSKA